jgi:hypothetical protein
MENKTPQDFYGLPRASGPYKELEERSKNVKMSYPEWQKWVQDAQENERQQTKEATGSLGKKNPRRISRGRVLE